MDETCSQIYKKEVGVGFYIETITGCTSVPIKLIYGENSSDGNGYFSGCCELLRTQRQLEVSIPLGLEKMRIFCFGR